MGLLSKMRERREEKDKEYYNTYYHHVSYSKLQKNDDKKHNCQLELTIIRPLDKNALPDIQAFRNLYICEDDKKDTYIFSDGSKKVYQENKRIKVYGKRDTVVELRLNESPEVSYIPVIYSVRIGDL